MKTTIKLGLLLLSLLAFSAQAVVISCVGMDENGATLHVLYDSDSSTLNLNGSVHKIRGDTPDHSGVSTVNFVADDGANIYYTLTATKDKSMFLSKFDAKTDNLITKINVTCINNQPK